MDEVTYFEFYELFWELSSLSGLLREFEDIAAEKQGAAKDIPTSESSVMSVDNIAYGEQHGGVFLSMLVPLLV